jgi:PAS domain S-box-containing protein
MRSALWTLAGVWLCVLVALGAWFAGASTDVFVSSVVGAALLVSALAMRAQAVRWRRTLAIMADARRLASSPDREALAPVPLPDDRGPGDDLDDLRTSLSVVASRMSGQVKELAKKSRNLGALVDGLVEPVLATGAERRVILCNRAAEILLQSRPGELVGRPISELFTRRELLEIHDVARTGQTRRGQVPITTSGGVRTFSVSASPLPPAWGEGVFGAVIVLRDVTELAQAVQVQKDFVANASHELRTPVAALRMAVETLADGAKDEPDMRDRLIGVCLAHVVRLEEMIRDLMDLSRLESPDLPVRIGPISLDDLQRTLRLTFEPICTQRGLELDFDLDPALDAMPSDPKLLQLIVRNLIDNATKFAHAHTTIRIVGRLRDEQGTATTTAPNTPNTANTAAAPEAPVDASAASSPSAAGVPSAPGLPSAPSPRAQLRRAYFAVTDRGVGIPVAQQARVFERFYQVDVSRSGTQNTPSSTGDPTTSAHANTPRPALGARRGSGLGLAIVKHAVTALDGSVGLESQWGEGTTVWVELPIHAEPLTR